MPLMNLKSFINEAYNSEPKSREPVVRELQEILHNMLLLLEKSFLPPKNINGFFPIWYFNTRNGIYHFTGAQHREKYIFRESVSLFDSSMTSQQEMLVALLSISTYTIHKGHLF